MWPSIRGRWRESLRGFPVGPGVKGMAVTTLEPGKQVSVAVEITNTGKTMARSSKTFSSLKFSLVPIDIPTFAVR